MKKYLPKTSQQLMVLFLVILPVFLTGCLGSSGKLQFNSSLLEQYSSQALSKTYTYYYCGRSTIPYAVVGIDPSHVFNDRFWFKIASEQEVYNKISNLSDLHIDSGPLTSSDILDGQGNKIGVWFSRYRFTPVRVDPETKMVEVYNPYNPNENSRGGF